MGTFLPVTFDYWGYTITTDKQFMHPQDIYGWLSVRAYWYDGLTFDTFKNGYDHSFCFGALIDGIQVGYGRLITDYATYGYLADVYVEDAHRGKGLSKIMLHTLLELDWVKRLRRINLRTRDAQLLYARFGFTAPVYPERIMGKQRDQSIVNKRALKNSEHVHVPFESGGQYYRITTDKKQMKPDEIHDWLCNKSYWAKGIPADIFQTSFKQSFCIGILHGERQVGFARLISDHTNTGYLADVYVEEQHRGRGISKAMLNTLLEMDWVRQVNINLVTKDGHALYEKFGFETCNPERIMELVQKGVYEGA